MRTIVKKSSWLVMLSILAISTAGLAEEAKGKKAEKKNTEQLAIIETTAGSITVKLFPEKAPKTVKNFVELSTGKKAWKDPKSGKDVTKKSLYAGTVFHRVIKNFMIQGGDPLGTGTGGPGYQFQDEFDSKDSFQEPGVLAMANSGPNTNGSQFFITVAPTPWLKGKHTVFGQVVKGMDVVEKIANSATGPNDAPIKEIKIKKITIKNS